MKKLIFRPVVGEPMLTLMMPGQREKMYTVKGSPYEVDEEEYAFLMKYAGHLFHEPKKTSRRAKTGRFASSKLKVEADTPKADESKAEVKPKGVLGKLAGALQGTSEKSNGQEESGEAKN